jgi:DNA-3-methyladenine glycosylase I
MQKQRCQWVNLKNPLYIKYHDKEWGRPVHKDKVLFEFLILEGAQAGLSWETILNKREDYRTLFAGFDPAMVAKFNAKKVSSLLLNPKIVRNKLKVNSAVTNAKAFLDIQKEFGSFNKYIWGFVNNKTIINNFKTLKDYPANTYLSDTISKDLKKRGFKFVGSTIIYSFMQAIGMVDDHAPDCWVRQKSLEKWWVYIIRCKDNSLYTGISNSVDKRFQEHSSQSGKCAKYLRGRAPLKLVFQHEIGSKSEALKAEAAIKKLALPKKRELIRLGWDLFGF